ncbi:MAG TPA: circularly permuted type 2 ATP-grasp protein, partial [Candidatus Methylacidiphilales bacterium]|nr:circularly permuted type 2 ATP-grasp protein [Candidatus Methylacidiphilales bacterium]
MALLDFEQYVEHATASDELRSENAFVARAYRQMERVVQALGQTGVDRLSRVAFGQMRDQGITFHIYHDERGTERIFPLDVIPLPIAGDEWADIEVGLAQRTRVWNMFLRDIYGPQEILKAGIVPYELVYSDPHFHRECVGIPVPRDTYVHVAAYDMVRHPGGKWMVMEDHLSNPTGASYALQARRVMSQVCPQMMEGISVAPIYNYPTQLLETLQAAAPNSAAGSRVVLLSPGIYNEAYYDHSSLARQMGIPLVQGNDLIVLDSKLFLKTIGGLERVDVIYRRLDTEYIDPVTFRSDSRLGIPGLISCLRKGTVTVANALGTGLADNRAISSFLPSMTEFYFNEKPRMKSVPTLHLYDLDQREEVQDKWSQYVIKHAIGRGPGSFWIGADLSEQDWTKLRQKINSDPRSFIAQPVVEFSTAPTWIDSALQPRHVGVRAFTLFGNTIHTAPCALTRVALEDSSLVVSSASGGGSKDTWILRSPTHRGAPQEVVLRHPPRRMRLSSRTADSLFWMGRYAERAEATTRILRVVEQIRLEASSGDGPRAWAPLWDALASATGHATSTIKKVAVQKENSRKGPPGLAGYILLSDENFSSTLSCLRHCRQNAQAIREALPPEVWTIINRIYLQMMQQAKNVSSERVKSQLRDLSLEDDILSQLDELTGCADKHMLHNDAWTFWQIGRHSERALFTLLTLRQVYMKRSNERTSKLAG